MRPVKKELKIIFAVGYTLLLVAGWYLVVDPATPQVSAGITGNDLTGWAWSETIGWISLNSANCDASPPFGFVDPSAPAGCPAPGTPISNYGVTVENESGTMFLKGYAWSEHIGWISFEQTDVSGCPPGGGCRPWRIGNELRGWARALSVSPSQGGNPLEGWDGWISLNCFNQSRCPISNYRVSIINSCDYSNYAWGGAVVGWISFNCANSAGTCLNSNYKVTGTGDACGAGPLAISCDHAPSATQTAGSPVTWIVTVTGGSGILDVNWSGTPGSNPLNTIPSIPPQVQVTIVYPTTGIKTGSVTVTDQLTSEVQSASCGSINITAGIISLTANPTRVVKGDTSDIIWTTDGFANNECKLSSSPSDGSIPPLPQPQKQDDTYKTPPLQQNITYTLTCDNGISDSKFVDVSVVQLPKFKEIPPQ